MANVKKRIVAHLRLLNDMEDVTVKVSGKRVKISHSRLHVADFRFKWIDDTHFVGYFVGMKKSTMKSGSHAIVSLWTPLEAVKFMSAYSTLVELGARRSRPM